METRGPVQAHLITSAGGDGAPLGHAYSHQARFESASALTLGFFPETASHDRTGLLQALPYRGNTINKTIFHAFQPIHTTTTIHPLTIFKRTMARPVQGR